ncbi:uncharacterized protein LOC122043015 isoform X1 [Zingiber officinale]|uniref:uncharacterized protein LOC122043015 isoform X1 n=1 Tax=Zingiber officinale TaxID=94328 RepID=UPI001C4AF588|nr:uncharacterized protein LOC122043015 isoform X1 [Zingiber officinale]XP_042459377.1 uncharacterized protein LOC122043015 isoform X1 [Zingiber officinale]XP_042459378.1 uncharacterized protein LOC122043015 isoform X1 [Zingiber officinale]XP_042459379.1 uncharacterized protein LOC122043015 isoform X1 [Zingiber officinale]
MRGMRRSSEASLSFLRTGSASTATTWVRSTCALTFGLLFVLLAVEYKKSIPVVDDDMQVLNKTEFLQNSQRKKSVVIRSNPILPSNVPRSLHFILPSKVIDRDVRFVCIIAWQSVYQFEIVCM